jgi:hypothetical protein
MGHSISKERIKQIINEEIKRRITLNEGGDRLDIDAIDTVSKNAKILLKAAYEFQDNAPPALINAFTPSLGEMIKKLEEMIQSPTQFVSKQKPELSGEKEKSKEQTGDLSMRPREGGGEKVTIKPSIRK